MQALREEEFAALVETAGAGELAELLREDHPLYDQRGNAAVVRMRGWILLTHARRGLTDDALLFVAEELDTGTDPYLVAAAARALRSYAKPNAALTPLVVNALSTIRYRDERVSLDRYGEYAVGLTGTTPVAELLETLTWLGPHASGVLHELESLRHDGIARKYVPQLDRAIAAIRDSEPIADDCCSLPGTFLTFAKRESSDAEPVVFEDHDGNEIAFDDLTRGHVSIVVFFYTRCDNPLKCSLTIGKLARVQQLLAERGLGDAIHTAAITYDPEYDVPERLRTYGRERGVQLGASHRMLRATQGFDALRRRFQLGVGFIRSLVNRHRIEAFILDRDGRVAASFQRLRWDEAELVAKAVEVAEEKPRKLTMPVAGTLASLAFAFFPKCAMCWAAYFSVFGIAGLSSIPYTPWLKWALALLMLLNIGSVWLRSRATHRLAGFYLVLAGAIAILASLQLASKPAAIAGVVLTMAGSVASTLLKPRRTNVRTSPPRSTCSPSPISPKPIQTASTLSKA